ncbi:hypothetical protein RHSIM_Rhsim05G0030500 [Rhododendron simsii]|uniref:Uncharacterized protein n=1 Tax=Rhododendron simsii TaxID=118357 RepID=A0A834H110_RHOSS|nr:hypothetical protein RHSIM_Rhsim05G0030500 [Rhododendron simsii]
MKKTRSTSFSSSPNIDPPKVGKKIVVPFPPRFYSLSLKSLAISDGARVIVDEAVGQLSQLVATGTCVHVEGELKDPPVEAKQRVELIGVQMILQLGTVDPAKYALPQTRLTRQWRTL